MKIRPVGAQLFHVDRRTGMTKLIVALRKFVNAPKNPSIAEKHYQPPPTPPLRLWQFSAFLKKIQHFQSSRSKLELKRMAQKHTRVGI
jgi:hypothetical protein